MLNAMQESCCVVDYVLGKSARKIASTFNTSHTAVLRVVNAAGVVRNRQEAKNNSLGKECLDDKTKMEIVKLYAEGKNAEELGKMYNRAPSYLGKIIKVLGTMRTLEEAQRLRRGITINEEAFDDLNNEEAAYFLGFIAGDGNVHQNRITVCLHEKDLGHVEKLKSFLGVSNRIYTSDKKPYVTLQVSSSKLCARLNELGITPNKSLTLVPNEELAKNRHYWRGEVDADGSLILTKDKKGRAKIVLSLIGSQASVEAFTKFIADNGIVSTSKILPKGRAAVKVVNGRAAVELINLLYKDCTVSLDRKQEKANIIMSKAPCEWFPGKTKRVEAHV